MKYYIVMTKKRTELTETFSTDVHAVNSIADIFSGDGPNKFIKVSRQDRK